jgi:hypothetical protein
MKGRRILGFVSTLSAISMLSVGFSSWKIIEVVPDSEVISVNTIDTIILQSEAISFTNPSGGSSIETFKYTKDGFLEDETFSGIAHIYLYFRVDMGKAKNSGFSDGTSLNMTATLSYGSGTDTSSIDILTSYLSGVYLAHYDNIDATEHVISEDDPTVSDQISSFETGTFNTTSNAATCFMLLTYVFDASGVYSTFETSIYDPLSSSGISFIINLSFESV